MGAIFIVIGFLLCLSILGAVVGIPMIFIGLILVALGGRRRTVITNVVQVSTGGERIGDFTDPSRLVHAPQTRRQREPEPLPYRPPTLTLQPQRSRAVPQSEPYGRGPEESDFDLDADETEEERFSDARTEVSVEARTVLKAARQEGFEVKVRQDSFVIRKGGYELVLCSNPAIEDFGRKRNY